MRRAIGKILSAKLVAPAPTQMPQPHLEVAVSPLGVDKAKQVVTRGHMMVDTGAAVTMVTRLWAEAHGLKVTQGKKINVQGAGGDAIPTVGVTTLTT